MKFTKAMWAIVALGLVIGAGVMYAQSASGRGAIPDEKAALLQRQEKRRTDALAADKPAKESVKPPIQKPLKPWPTGVFETGQAPFRSGTYDFNNQWQDLVSGEYRQVFAGSYTNNPDQGVVVVLGTTPDLKGGSGASEHPTPTKAGSVRIMKAEGAILTLIAENGETFTFNAASRQFVAPSK